MIIFSDHVTIKMKKAIKRRVDESKNAAFAWCGFRENYCMKNEY